MVGGRGEQGVRSLRSLEKIQSTLCGKKHCTVGGQPAIISKWSEELKFVGFHGATKTSNGQSLLGKKEVTRNQFMYCPHCAVKKTAQYFSALCRQKNGMMQKEIVRQTA